MRRGEKFLKRPLSPDRVPTGSHKEQSSADSQKSKERKLAKRSTIQKGRFEHLRFQHGQGCVQTALLQAVRVLALALSSSTTGARRPTRAETCATEVAIYQDQDAAMSEWFAPWLQRAVLTQIILLILLACCYCCCRATCRWCCGRTQPRTQSVGTQTADVRLPASVTVMTQSQVKYTWWHQTPRFTPLADREHGAWRS